MNQGNNLLHCGSFRIDESLSHHMGSLLPPANGLQSGVVNGGGVGEDTHKVNIYQAHSLERILNTLSMNRWNEMESIRHRS